VGQGDATALACGGRWWLVDAGPRSPHQDAGQGVVLPFLRWAAVRRLSALALTHDDGDHTGGARAVLRGIGVARVWASPPFSGIPGPGARFGAASVARGDTLVRFPRIVALWPPRASEPAAAAIHADNAAGLVFEVGEGAGRVLLAADVDSTVEDSLAVAPGIALLKVAHHGSGSSSGARFLERVRPRLAALSCGARNPFGHPEAGALARLSASGATLLRTDREGALWFELSSEGVRRVDWQAGEPLVARESGTGGGGAAPGRPPPRAVPDAAAAARRAALARPAARW
jgi:competence protein ComEC